jgi:tetratricopeptide (TPR) repeat protein
MTAKSRKQQLQDMLADDPNDPFLRYGLAMECISEGDDDQAVKCFRELFAVAPDYVPAYLQAGQTLTRLDRVSEAQEMFRTGITIANKVGDAHAAGEMQGFLEGLS